MSASSVAIKMAPLAITSSKAATSFAYWQQRIVTNDVSDIMAYMPRFVNSFRMNICKNTPATRKGGFARFW